MAIINAPGSGFDVLLETLLNKQKLEQEKERINLQKKDFEFRQATAKAEQERLQNAIAGAQVAAKLFIQQRPDIASAAPSRPGELPAFVESLQGFQQQGVQTALTGAQARSAGAAADVAEATVPAAIKVANLEPEVLRQRLVTAQAEEKNLEARTRGINLNNEYQGMLNKLGPEFVGKLTQARGLFETGSVTWGEARKTAGLPEVKDGISDDTVFVDASNTIQNAEALKNQSFARQMQISNSLINQLEDDGVRLALLPSLQRQTQSATFDAVVNMIAGPEQRRLINAQRMFGDAYRFSLSGQQSSDREALRMLNTISSQVGDDAQTIAQKRVLREVMANVTAMKAGGEISNVDGARMGLRAAQNTGDEETIAVFQEILDLAVSKEQGVNAPPSNAPIDQSNAGNALDEERINRLLGLN